VTTLEGADLRMGQVHCIDAYSIPGQNGAAGLSAYYCRSLQGTGPLRVEYRCQTGGNWSTLYDWVSQEIQSLGLTMKQVLGITYCADPACGMMAILFFEQPLQSTYQHTAADVEFSYLPALTAQSATPDRNQQSSVETSAATEPAPEPVDKLTEAVTKEPLSVPQNAAVRHIANGTNGTNGTNAVTLDDDDEPSDIGAEVNSLPHTPSSTEFKSWKVAFDSIANRQSLKQDRQQSLKRDAKDRAVAPCNLVAVAEARRPLRSLVTEPVIIEDKESTMPTPICGPSVGFTANTNDMIASFKSMLSAQSSQLQQWSVGGRMGGVTRSDRRDYDSDGFEVMMGKNVGLDSSGHQMLVSNIQECKRLCRFRGYGAFVISGGRAFFKKQDVTQCLERLVDQPGCTVYLDVLRCGSLAIGEATSGSSSALKRSYAPTLQRDMRALQTTASREMKMLHGDEPESQSNRWNATISCAASRRNEPDCITQ